MKVKNILFMSLLASTMMLGACGGSGSSSESKGGDSSGGTSQDTSSESGTSEGGTSQGGTSQDSSAQALPEGTYDITMWGSETEGVPELFAQQVDDFEELNPGVVINLTYEEVSEANAASKVLTSLDEAADIYCFAQDQFADLVLGQALSRLGQAAAKEVSTRNDAGSVAAVTSGEYLYGYPMTSDNGYFMYYDKSVISEDIVDDMEEIVKECEAAGRTFSMETSTSAWYLASFFFGAGCVSEWTTNADGDFIDVKDDFNSAKGLVAMRGMQHLVKSANYVSSSSVKEQFAAAIQAAVVVSGTWDYNNAVEALGDNLGVAALPSFDVDGQEYHLGSFSGNKLMGVKPQVDAKKLQVCHALANYLTDAKCQEERFDAVAWGPSNLEVAASDKVQANPALAALLAQAPYARPQGAIPGAWWDFAKTLGSAAAAADNDDTVALQAALDSYYESLDQVVHPSEVPVWALVGTINGGAWNAATATYMEEKAGGMWEVTTEIAEGNEFKVCKVLKEAGTVADWTYGAAGVLNPEDLGDFFNLAGDNIVCSVTGEYTVAVNPNTGVTITAHVN